MQADFAMQPAWFPEPPKRQAELAKPVSVWRALGKTTTERIALEVRPALYSMQVMRHASYAAARRDAQPLMFREDASISVLAGSDSTSAAPSAPNLLVAQDSHWRGHYQCAG